MSEQGRKLVARLVEFHEAIGGNDRAGDGTCGICGRSGIKTWRVSSVNPATGGLRKVELCAPCLSEDLGTEPPIEPDAAGN